MDFQKYKDTAAKITGIVHALWSKVTFITVAEVIQKEVDTRELDKQCWQLKDHVTNLNHRLRLEIDQIPENEYFDKYEDRHLEIEDLIYALDNKLDAIDIIVQSLKEIQDKSDEDDFNKLFRDIAAFPIGESVIRLRRVNL